MPIRMTIAASLLALACICHAADPKPGEARAPSAGPISHGLRLGLSIVTEVKDGRDMHHFELLLRNVSDEPVTLIGEWREETPAAGYDAYVRSAVTFNIDPAVLIVPPGRNVPEPRTSPQPVITIEPGQRVPITWTAIGSEIIPKEGRPYRYINLKTKGQYGVKASTIVKMKDGPRVKLVSQEAPLIVGASYERPKPTLVPILSGDAEKRTVTIGLGSLDHVAVGDVYTALYGKTPGWFLRVTEVRETTAAAEAKIAPDAFDGKGDSGAPFPMTPADGPALLTDMPPGDFDKVGTHAPAEPEETVTPHPPTP